MQHNFSSNIVRHKPRAHFGHVMGSHHGHQGSVGGLLVHSDMDIVEQTNLFSHMDPFHVQFIPTPKLNAGGTYFVEIKEVKIMFSYFSGSLPLAIRN